MFSDAQIKALNAPLDPKYVVKPSGSFGPKGDYLEGWHVINEMNRVFGFDGWSYTINLTRDALERVEGKDQWAAAYTCICTLTVAGVTRQDVGFGSGFAKGVGDAIEGATKEAATDALKRAARTFGNVFGLALYDKTRANVSAPPVELITDDQRDEITVMAQGAGVGLDKICAAAGADNLKAIPAANYSKIINKLKATMTANAQQKAA